MSAGFITLQGLGLNYMLYLFDAIFVTLCVYFYVILNIFDFHFTYHNTALNFHR